LGSVVALLCALYYAVPNRRVAFRDALAGGIAASLGLVLTQRLFGLYVAMFPSYALIYGAFATLPIFLVWLYLSWCVVLIGALVTALLPEFRAGTHAAPRYPGRSFYACLRMLQALAGARGQVCSLQQLSEAGALSLAEAESLLEEMSIARWTVRVGVEVWRLGRRTEDLKLSDVFARFAFSPLALPAAANVQDARLRERLLRAYGQASTELGVPLSELFQIG
jgi:membrane protein